LTLSGGLALGAYQAGAYAALHESGLRPHGIAGSSIGAINGAIIAGNPPDLRVDRLRQFWDAAAHSPPPWPQAPPGFGHASYRHAAALWTRLLGHPRLFRACFPFGSLALPGMPGGVGFYDLRPLQRTLEPLIDFDRLNAGDVRLSVSAVDIMSGNEVLFETRRQRIGAAHLAASAAFPPDFLPVEIDGRLLGDGAMASNVPLRAALDDNSGRDLLCFVIDLFDRNGGEVSSIDAALVRQYELIFANQCQREIDAQRQICELRRLIWLLGELLPAEIRRSRTIAPILQEGSGRAIGLLHLTYRASAREGPMKAYDFSRVSLIERWRAGAADMARALEMAAEIVSGPRRPGLTVHRIPPALP
jgi:NTE family protein